MQAPAFPGQRLVASAERLGALAEKLAVAPHPLRVDGRDRQHLLRLCVVGIEPPGPSDPVLARPPIEDLLRRPQAGAGVDHGRPADRPADRGRNRRAPLADR